MSSRMVAIAVSVSVAVCIGSFAGVASATPIDNAHAMKNALPSMTENVQWAGRWGYRGWGWRGRGWGWGVGSGLVAGAIVGGALAAPYYGYGYPYYGYAYPYPSYGYYPYYGYGYPYYGAWGW